MHKIVTNSIPLLSSLSGIGRYAFEISNKLGAISDRNFIYYYGHYSKKLLTQPTQSVLTSKVKSLLVKNSVVKKIARKIIMSVGSLYRPTFELYWEPSFIPLDSIKAKKVITSVHDFSFILYKDFHPKERIEYFEKYFFKNIYRSDMIITGSEYTKREILRRLDFDESKVRVIYHGVRHDVFRPLDDLRLGFELPKRFILSVGSLEPRKNLIGLLNAYNLLDDTIKDEYKLILVGFKGWENKEIMRLIELNKNNVQYLGYISDEDLAKVYNLASVFVYPSFYEGFGLPPLEAMACGLPVVTSNVSSLPEVGGDAVIYCDPNDIVDIKNKIELVLGDGDMRADMKKKGLEQAAKFTWEKSAVEHLAVFEELLP